MWDLYLSLHYELDLKSDLYMPFDLELFLEHASDPDLNSYFEFDSNLDKDPDIDIVIDTDLDL